jgi:hypothetical protein
LAWIGHQPRGHLGEGAADVQRIGVAVALGLALQEVGHDALAALATSAMVA